MSKLAVLHEGQDHVRPMGAARPIQHLVTFPIEVIGESYFRYSTVAKRAMREFVGKVLGGMWYETDGDALVVVQPRAVESAGRELTNDETALLAFAVRDYRIAQETSRVHRIGPRFAR